MNKQVIAIIFFILGSLTFAAIVMAQPGGPTSVTPGASSRANLSTATPASITAQAGNVSELNVAAISITQAWTGYYGNISGEIVLADSNNNWFYNWTGLGSISGEVYASKNDTITWANINCSNGTQIAQENDYLGKDASDADSVTNTFALNSHPEVSIGSVTIATNTCNSTNAYTNAGASGTDYYQILLADNSNRIVYTALIDDNQLGFDGTNHDFELLVGVNGNATSPTSTTYYMYIELS